MAPNHEITFLPIKSKRMTKRVCIAARKFPLGSKIQATPENGKKKNRKQEIQKRGGGLRNSLT